ncbi:MAG: IS1380 family transposase, partial [Lutibacter sp.]|nr:IS1380 family transposase [Lutibacter sp.]MCF6169037.1 IS1380 family transposase [Lutibacter sp.]
QFDVIKNDFGWNHMPFSHLNTNTVFLYLMAMCKNIYHIIIQRFSKIFEGLNPTNRMKKFLFRFIILPAKWTRRSRQDVLRVYGEIRYRT